MGKITEENKIVYDRTKGIPFGVAGKSKMPDTGSWKVFKPVIDERKCIKCLTCWMHCPDTAIRRTEDDKPKVDYAICKGCGACAEVCPVKAIEMVKAK